MDYIDKSIIVSILVLVFAILGYFFTPAKKSSFGYKTPMSLKNNSTWNYANGLAKRLFLFIAVVFIIIELFLYSKMEDFKAYRYSLWFLTITSIMIIPIIEIMLNLKFDKNGNEKN